MIGFDSNRLPTVLPTAIMATSGVRVQGSAVPTLFTFAVSGSCSHSTGFYVGARMSTVTATYAPLELTTSLRTATHGERSQHRLWLRRQPLPPEKTTHGSLVASVFS
ncbi:hypothetical protein SprV_0100051000 [Sparganum proliferum]